MKRISSMFFILCTATVVSLAFGFSDKDVQSVQQAFERDVAALNTGNFDGFLDNVHEEALSFYSCGPTSGKQGREACAVDWQLFFDTTTNARFETK